MAHMKKHFIRIKTLSSNLYKIPEMETTYKKNWQQQNTKTGYII